MSTDVEPFLKCRPLSTRLSKPDLIGVEAQLSVHFEHFFLRDADARPEIIVQSVVVGYNRVEGVVTAHEP